MLLDKYVSVEHLTPDASNSNEEGYLADLGLQAVKVNIQPSSPEIIALNGGAYGKSYTVFTTASGILETDRITTVSGTQVSKVFIVKGKQHFDYGIGAKHVELYIEEVL
jgi:hypothetical protein